MPKWLRDVSDLWMGFRGVLKAQGLLERARRLRRDGRVTEAFRVAVEAFAILRERDNQVHPAGQALVATDAVLVDELARELGHPDAARDDLAVALRICEDMAEGSPRLQPQLQQYIDWYRYRLAEVDRSAVH